LGSAAERTKFDLRCGNKKAKSSTDQRKSSILFHYEKKRGEAKPKPIFTWEMGGEQAKGQRHLQEKKELKKKLTFTSHQKRGHSKNQTVPTTKCKPCHNMTKQ